MKIEPIEDGNSDFTLVSLSIGYLTVKSYPTCAKHGAMNKVSVTETGGYWRCLQGQCRAGCNQLTK